MSGLPIFPRNIAPLQPFPQTAIPISLALGHLAFLAVYVYKEKQPGQRNLATLRDLLTNTFNDILFKKTYRV